jgi:hypothetical protein
MVAPERFVEGYVGPTTKWVLSVMLTMTVPAAKTPVPAMIVGIIPGRSHAVVSDPPRVIVVEEAVEEVLAEERYPLVDADNAAAPTVAPERIVEGAIETVN